MTESTHGPKRRSPEAAASAMCRSRSVDGRDRSWHDQSGRRDAARAATGCAADLGATSFRGTPTDSGFFARGCRLGGSALESERRHRSGRDGEFDVVPRVSQPYYTSLSAVTAPLLVPRPSVRLEGVPSVRKSAGLPPNLLGTRRRTTSPGRIWPAALDRPGCTANALQKRNAGDLTGRSANCSVRSRSSDASVISRMSPSVESRGHGMPPLPPSPANCSNNGLRDGVRRTDDARGTSSLDNDCVNGNGYVSENDQIESRSRVVHDAVKTEDDLARRSAANSHMPAPVVDAASPRQIVGRVRSLTMPSDVSLTANKLSQPSVELGGGSSGGRSMQQPRSVSFTGLLSRMSPKSIRRLFSGHAGGLSKPSGERFGDDSVHDRCRSAACARSAASAVDDVTPKKGAKLAALRQWFSGRRRSKDSAVNVGDSGNVASPHADHDDVETHTCAPCASNDVTADPECRYACRQGKLSPKQGTTAARDAALGLITQPLYVVEFPDNFDASPTAADARTGVNSADSTANGRKPPTVPGSRRLAPPTSLEVRAVLGARKSVFRFPSSSVESIGRCSLDASYSNADTGKHSFTPCSLG
jgi:hypothetical protein